MSHSQGPIAELIEGGGFRVRAYVANYDDVPITAAMVSLIGWATYDVADPETPIDDGTLATSAILSEVRPWVFDSTGYNCQFVLPGAAIPDGGKVVQVQIKITLTDYPDAPIYVGKGKLPQVRVTEVFGG